MSNYERCVRLFLRDHPEHCAGAKRDPNGQLVLDREAALSFAEWALRVGLASDPAKLRASIARLRAELHGEGN